LKYCCCSCLIFEFFPEFLARITPGISICFGGSLITLLLSSRQKQIIQALRPGDEILLSELAQRISISESTLRRELSALEEIDLVQRKSGKVRPAYSIDNEIPFLARTAINEDEKKRIAKAALDLVLNGETIFIAGGTTTLEFARLLPGRYQLIAVTNALPVANALIGRRGIKLVVLGGEVRREEQTMHGHLTIIGSQELRADKLFYGVEGFSLEHGITHSQLVEVSTDRALISACAETILLADHTKFGRVAPALVAPISQVHRIVTGRELESEYVSGLRASGIQVILA
jgi:DeoR/GlpR family transcriptional regulator of sugar metabolism